MSSVGSHLKHAAKGVVTAPKKLAHEVAKPFKNDNDTTYSDSRSATASTGAPTHYTSHQESTAPLSQAKPTDIAQVLGDPDEDQPMVERVRAEEAELQRLFDLSDNEHVIDDFAAALRKKNLLLHGRLYIFGKHVGFHSTLPFNYTKTRIIPLEDIVAIRKKRHWNAPSAIDIVWNENGERTTDLFTRFAFRDDAFRLLMAVWKRARGEQGPAVGLTAAGVIAETQPPTAEEEEEEEVEDTAELPPGAVKEVGAPATTVDWVVKDEQAPAVNGSSKKIHESQLNTSVRGFCDRFLSSGQKPFMKEFHESRGDHDVVVTKWQNTEEVGEVRELRFVSPVKAKIGPPQTNVHETHRYTVYNGGKHLVFEISSVATDIPYGDCFSIQTRWDVTEVSAEQVGVAVSLDIPFSKKTMWRKAIESGVTKATTESTNDWVHMANQVIQRKPAPSVPAGATPDAGTMLEPMEKAVTGISTAQQQAQAAAQGVGEGPSEELIQSVLKRLPLEMRGSVAAILHGEQPPPTGSWETLDKKEPRATDWLQKLPSSLRLDHHNMPALGVLLAIVILLQAIILVR